MNKSGVYTKRAYGLDKNVWLVLFVTIILALCLLSYRLVEKKECTLVEFSIRSLEENTDSVHTVGEELSFTVTNGLEDVTWDFGDKTEKVHESSVKHKFMLEGKYSVSAANIDGCENFKTVTIIKAKPVQTAGSQIAPDKVIAGNISTVAGREERFLSLILAKNYEWSCDKLGGVQQTPDARFIFPIKGIYRIKLMLDNNREIHYYKDVFVADSIKIDNSGPIVEAPPPPKVFQNISDELFKVYLGKVVDGDFTVDNFNDFLPKLGKTPVTLNGKPMDFATACAKLNGMKRRQLGFWKKKVSITSVKQTREGIEDNTVSIEIKHNG